MKITTENYFEQYAKLDLSKVPHSIKKGHKSAIIAAENDWKFYNSNEKIRQGVDNYFNLFSQIIFGTQEEATEKTPKKVPTPKQKTTRKDKATKSQKIKSTTRTTQAKTMRVESDQNAEKVTTFSTELKFIRRYVNMNGKEKSRNQIRLFINALQKAIRDKLIRKTSKYEKEIMDIQDNVIYLHGRFKNDKELLEVEITESKRVKYLKILGKEIEYPSIKLIKSYINLQGKIIDNIKASRLLNRIKNAIDRKRFNKRDPYWKEVQNIIKNLNSFVKKNEKHGVLQIEEQTLNGLNEIVNCECGEPEILDGVKIPEELDIEKLTENYFAQKKKGDNRFLLNSKAYSNINFQTFGFSGRWLKLFGDPEVGFSAVIQGRPKMGKSTLAITFSGDMAENHGAVLYIAREEGKSETFKSKLKKAAATHNNLYVSNYIPVNLREFKFVIFDSVTKMGLTPRHLEALKNTFPTSFIGIHQVTKDGKARGTNEYIHDADIIIEVNKVGYATSRGRFNEGGELDFFNKLAAA